MSMMHLFFFARLILVAALLSNPAIVSGEPLRIVYTAISLMYGPRSGLSKRQAQAPLKKITSMWSSSISQGEPLSTAALVGTSRHAFWFNVKFPNGDSCPEFANNQACNCPTIDTHRHVFAKKVFWCSDCLFERHDGTGLAVEWSHI